MTSYVCLLRSVNVAGRMIKMAALREQFVALGYGQVVSYIQSGNVVFVSPGHDTLAMAGAIEARITQVFGLQVSVVLRTREEMAEAIADNPFVGTAAEPAKLHVTFLARAADPGRLLEIDPSAFWPDEFHLVGRQVHLHCPAGYGQTKLNNAWWERRLKVVATTRNWNTVNKLHQLADAGVG